MARARPGVRPTRTFHAANADPTVWTGPVTGTSATRDPLRPSCSMEPKYWSVDHPGAPDSRLIPRELSTTSKTRPPLRHRRERRCSRAAGHHPDRTARCQVARRNAAGHGSWSRPADGRAASCGVTATRVANLWHLRRDRADATEVEIRFAALGAAATRVEIEHRGWERLGAGGQEWRDRNLGGWSTLLPHDQRAAAAAWAGIEAREEPA